MTRRGEKRDPRRDPKALSLTPSRDGPCPGKDPMSNSDPNQQDKEGEIQYTFCGQDHPQQEHRSSTYVKAFNTASAVLAGWAGAGPTPWIFYGKWPPGDSSPPPVADEMVPRPGNILETLLSINPEQNNETTQEHQRQRQKRKDPRST